MHKCFVFVAVKKVYRAQNEFGLGWGVKMGFRDRKKGWERLPKGQNCLVCAVLCVVSGWMSDFFFSIVITYCTAPFPQFSSYCSYNSTGGSQKR